MLITTAGFHPFVDLESLEPTLDIFRVSYLPEGTADALGNWGSEMLEFKGRA